MFARGSGTDGEARKAGVRRVQRELDGSAGRARSVAKKRPRDHGYTGNDTVAAAGVCENCLDVGCHVARQEPAGTKTLPQRDGFNDCVVPAGRNFERPAAHESAFRVGLKRDRGRAGKRNVKQLADHGASFRLGRAVYPSLPMRGDTHSPSNERRSPANAGDNLSRARGAAAAGECRRQSGRPPARNGR